ncbi:MAG: ABC transporter permease [Microscillaceae bacterium]|nr:ABC transporter permease [Microscillaceae bacterium]MDW8460568.1 ABC transporter permease [Cytophagales bacterium]
MLRFIFRRLGYGILVILGVIIVVFVLFFALPGDPISVLAPPSADKATKEAIRKEFGLDKPLYMQLAYYLNDLSPLGIHENTPQNLRNYQYIKLLSFSDKVLLLKVPYLRRSYQSQKLVSAILLEDLYGTIILSVVAMFFATLVGIVLGIIAALWQNTWVDYTLVTLSVLGISMPSFVLAILVAVIFGFYLQPYTGLSLTGSLWVDDPFTGYKLQLKNLILPAFTLAVRPLAIIVQLTRSSMLEVLSQDYIRTAKAKGLLFRQVIYKHALKNALNPVITAVSGWFASLLAGAFFIEYIFNWKGIGKTTIDAVQALDLPVVMGATIIIAIIFIVVNILVDILYAVIDPRIRLK